MKIKRYFYRPKTHAGLCERAKCEVVGFFIRVTLLSIVVTGNRKA